MTDRINEPHAIDFLADYAKEHGWSAMLRDVASLCQHEGDRVLKDEGLSKADYCYRAADYIVKASEQIGEIA